MPRNEPIDLADPGFGIEAALGTGNGDCSAVGGALSGTVTFAELSNTSAAGSFDVSLTGATDCSGNGRIDAEYRWKEFVAPDEHRDCE